jgi:putative transposase
VAKIVDDTEQLLSFLDHPVKNGVHLRTTTPIESTFATVRLGTEVTKASGSRTAGVAMAFRVIEAARDRWRATNAPRLVTLADAGAKSNKDVMVERPNQQETEVAAHPPTNLINRS